MRYNAVFEINNNKYTIATELTSKKLQKVINQWIEMLIALSHNKLKSQNQMRVDLVESKMENYAKIIVNDKCANTEIAMDIKIYGNISSAKTYPLISMYDARILAENALRKE